MTFDCDAQASPFDPVIKGFHDSYSTSFPAWYWKSDGGYIAGSYGCLNNRHYGTGSSFRYYEILQYGASGAETAPTLGHPSVGGTTPLSVVMWGVESDVDGASIVSVANSGTYSYPMLYARNDTSPYKAVGGVDKEGGLHWGDVSLNAVALDSAGGAASPQTLDQAMDCHLKRTAAQTLTLSGSSVGSASLVVSGSVRASNGGTFEMTEGHDTFIPLGFPMMLVAGMSGTLALNATGGDTTYLAGPGGTHSSTLGFRMVRAGSITGMSVRFNVTTSTTSGVFAVESRIANTVAMSYNTATISSTGVKGKQVVQDRNTAGSTFTAGQLIQISVTEGTFVGELDNLEVILEVVY